VAERDADGRARRMIGTHSDVTALRRAESDLQSALARLEVAVEGGDLGLYEVNLIAGEAKVNERYLTQLGLPPDDNMTVERWESLLHPDDRERLRQTTADVFSGRLNSLSSEYRMRHAAGGWRWFLDRWRVYARDEQGRVLRAAGVHLDITERKEAEAALAELNRTLEERVAERTAEVHQQAAQLRALASELSRAERRERQRLARTLHDHVQQLIVAAQMQVDWMAREADPERLQSAAQGVRRALDEALEASRSLTVELSPPVLQEAGLIGGLNWLVPRMRDQYGLSVRFRADTSAEPEDEETRLLLFECARELLLNAVKHAGIDRAEIALMRPGDDEIRLIVSDEGSGFDPDVVRRRKPQDTSFGLFSIQERLTHLGGQTDIESAPGRGTRVTLTVPVIEAPPAAATAPARQGQPRNGIALRRPPDACRVLIVDDHQIVREGLAGLLQFESDIEVIGAAADGVRAIELTAALKPDVVIMDVNLGPGIDGVEATRRVCTVHPSVKVIGLSMHLDADVANAMRQAGAVGYLTKGGPSEGLLEAIRTCRAG
jgi:PAS domain S-box-containing protein